MRLGRLRPRLRTARSLWSSTLLAELPFSHAARAGSARRRITSVLLEALLEALQALEPPTRTS